MATATSFEFPTAVAVDNEDQLHVADTSGRIRQIRTALPPARAAVEIASEDGTVIYRFDSGGRHLETVDTTSGVRVLAFHDAAGPDGLLESIEDASGNVTRIVRDSTGRVTGIVAPFGQPTALTVGSSGWLERAENELNEGFDLLYWNGGLLRSFANPRGFGSTMEYDLLGRLYVDHDAETGSTTLARTERDDGYEVSQVTALGRTSTDVVERLADGTERRTHTSPTGASAETVIAPGGTRSTTYPDGTEVSITSGPDPRFGMIVPRTTAIVTRTPGGRRKVVETTREAVLSSPADPLSLESLVDTASINGRTFTSTYLASTRQLTTLSPERRPSTTTFDSLGRPVSVQLGNLPPVVLAYDSVGRLASRTQGTRTWSFGYDPTRGVLISSTDPLTQTVGLTSNVVGRMLAPRLVDAPSAILVHVT